MGVQKRGHNLVFYTANTAENWFEMFTLQWHTSIIHFFLGVRNV